MNLSLNDDVKLVNFKKGDSIFLEGDKTSKFYIVTEGKVCSFVEKENRAIPIHVSAAKELLGEECIFKDKYFYNAVAIEDVEVAIVEAKDAMLFLDANSNWIKSILMELSTKLSNTINSIKDHQIIDSDMFEEGFTPELEKLLLNALS